MTGGAYDLYLETYRYREGIRAKPRKYELTFQRGGWVQAFLAKEQQRVNAGELSASRFAAVRGTLFYFRDWAGAAMDASSVSGQTLSRYHAHLLDLVGSNTCSSTYAKGRMVSLKTFIRWLWGQDVIESLPKNVDSRELQFTRRIVTPETMTNDDVRALLSGNNSLLRLCILLGLNSGMTQKDISDLLDRDVDDNGFCPLSALGGRQPNEFAACSSGPRPG